MSDSERDLEKQGIIFVYNKLTQEHPDKPGLWDPVFFYLKWGLTYSAAITALYAAAAASDMAPSPSEIQQGIENLIF